MNFLRYILELLHGSEDKEPYHLILFVMWQIALQLVRQGTSNEPAPVEVVESNEQKVELIDESSQNSSGSDSQSDSELIKESSQEQKVETSAETEKISGDLLADDSLPNQPVDFKVFKKFKFIIHVNVARIPPPCCMGVKYSLTLKSNQIGVI